jgi:hypothetical protein
MQYYRLAEAAHRTGVPYQLLYRAMVAGRLPAPTHVPPMRRTRYYTEHEYREVIRIIEEEQQRAASAV